MTQEEKDNIIAIAEFDGYVAEYNQIDELVFDGNTVTGIYAPYPIGQLFKPPFNTDNSYVSFEFNLSCSSCSNCSGQECGGYIIKNMPIELFNTYKVIDEDFYLQYPKYNEDWNVLMSVCKKIKEKRTNPCKVELSMLIGKLNMALMDLQIDKVYECAIDCIKWFNENK